MGNITLFGREFSTRRRCKPKTDKKRPSPLWKHKPQLNLNLLELKGGQVQKMHLWEIEKKVFTRNKRYASGKIQHSATSQRKKVVTGTGMRKNVTSRL